jgi:hypothetical protein
MEQTVELPQVKNMSKQERAMAQLNVAMKSKEHLLEWTKQSGREWLVLNAREVIEALPWPDGHEALQQVIMCVRDHRWGQGKEEGATVIELDRAIRFLIGKVTSQDPNWSLENPPQ